MFERDHVQALQALTVQVDSGRLHMLPLPPAPNVGIGGGEHEDCLQPVGVNVGYNFYDPFGLDFVLMARAHI